MKRAVLLLLACALFVGVMAAPSQARVDNDQVDIQIQGVPFFGEWAFIGGRPYVGIESFGKALGFPREHNVLGWCLNPPPPPATACTVSPFALAVQSKGKNLRTVRFGGNTMVDLRQALDVLDIPFHYGYTDAQTFYVGNPYEGESMKGAWYRWRAMHYDLHGKGWSGWPLDRSEIGPLGF